jgi:CHASE3 domain sensor protein
MGQSETRAQRPLWAVVILCAAGIGLMVAAVLAEVRRATEARESAIAWTAQAYESIVAANDLLATLQAIETGQRGYLLTGDASFRTPYDTGRRALPGLLSRLRTQAEADPAQARAVEAIANLTENRIAKLDRGVALLEAGRKDAAIALIQTGEGRRTMEAVKGGIDAFKTTEWRILGERRAAAEQAARETVAVANGALAVGIILVFAAVIVGFSALRAANGSRPAARVSAPA